MTTRPKYTEMTRRQEEKTSLEKFPLLKLTPLQMWNMKPVFLKNLKVIQFLAVSVKYPCYIFSLFIIFYTIFVCLSHFAQCMFFFETLSQCRTILFCFVFVLQKLFVYICLFVVRVFLWEDKWVKVTNKSQNITFLAH